ncbi:MAG: hypothetical protein ACOYOK_07920 [Pseudobdellovibrionaceae bacterium]
MRFKRKRLFFAAAISLSVYAVNAYWYFSSEKKFDSLKNEKPLAFVGKTVEEIQRRPAARLLWQNVETGDPLYNGEAIRTAENAEVRILFAGTNRYLDVEPESLIVLQKLEGKISLDLLEGNLFVHSSDIQEKENTSEDLVVKSENGTLDLSNATASLSKTKNRKMDLQILSGQVSVKDKNGTKLNLSSINNSESNKFLILSPKLGKPLYASNNQASLISFQWKGWENKNVQLQIGTHRKNLLSTISNNKNGSSLQTALSVGKYYWKLNALNEKSQVIGESAVYKLEVLPLATLVDAANPVSTAAITKQLPIDVQWTLNEKQNLQYYVQQPQLHLAWTSPQKDKIFAWRLKWKEQQDSELQTQTVQQKKELTFQLNKPGRYLASVEALDNKNQVLGVTPEKTIEVLEQPLIDTPRFSFAQGLLKAEDNGRISLQWSNVSGAKEYNLVISKNGRELKKTSLTSTNTSFKNLMPGEYQVQLFATDFYGRKSQQTDSRTIVVPDKSNVKAPTLKRIRVN